MKTTPREHVRPSTPASMGDSTVATLAIAHGTTASQPERGDRLPQPVALTPGRDCVAEASAT